jgi:cysteine-rich repeat protein
MGICDDGNTNDGDGCSGTCEPECGYNCTVTGTGLSQCRPRCGDGVTSSIEQCDDGNVLPGDGCSPTCTIEAEWECNRVSCGASSCTPKLCGCTGYADSCATKCDARTTCSDNGFCNNDGTCTCFLGFTGPNCVSQCGDGIIVDAEKCEHQFTNKSTPGCSANCEILQGWTLVRRYSYNLTSTCGDGVVAIGAEQCDDGNVRSGDGEKHSCAYASLCICACDGGGGEVCPELFIHAATIHFFLFPL